MEEKELKTSTKQRIVIILIAILMLGSIIASYIMIIMNGNKSNANVGDSNISQEKIIKYEEAYNEKVAELAKISQNDFDRFIKYRSEIKAFNENSANSSGVQIRDIEIGSGRTLALNDSDYLAYYVGWCADESIFDSSFNDNTNPTSFAQILDASLGMIEGWNLGMEGMNIDGIREITIAGELAYKDKMEICGGYNKPLKFIVMTKAKEGALSTVASELDEAYMKLQYAYYGVEL